MPYRPTKDGQMEFSGKVSDWMRDFHQWYVQDFGNVSEVQLLPYIQYLTMFYATLAKGKWQDGILTKSKAKALDSYTSLNADGNVVFQTYEALDFLAENLKSEDRNKWSQHCRNEVAKLLKPH